MGIFLDYDKRKYTYVSKSAHVNKALLWSLTNKAKKYLCTPNACFFELL